MNGVLTQPLIAGLINHYHNDLLIAFAKKQESQNNNKTYMHLILELEKSV